MIRVLCRCKCPVAFGQKQSLGEYLSIGVKSRRVNKDQRRWLRCVIPVTEMVPLLHVAKISRSQNELLVIQSELDLPSV